MGNQTNKTKNKIKIKNNMKFSTPLTLAAITLMSTTGSTNARIGGGQRFLNDGAVCEDPSTYISEIAQCSNLGSEYTCQNVRLGALRPKFRCVATAAPIDPLSCTDPSTHNPIATPQCINVGTDYTCQNVRLGGTPEYRCVAPEVVSCTNPDNYNKTFTPQCINVGSGGYTCKNIRLGGDEPEYQCVPPSGRQ